MKEINYKKTKLSIQKLFSQNKRYSLFLLFLILVDMQFGMLNEDFIIKKMDSDLHYSTMRLSSALYFVHGYKGNNQDFSDMIRYLNQTSFFQQYSTPKPYFFSYFQKYDSKGLSWYETHFIFNGITVFATDFFQYILSNHNNFTKIDIIAHSLGGIIVREMARLFKSELENRMIYIENVITLGTPHLGTKLATHPLKNSIEIFTGDEWNTPIIESISPSSAFISRLNAKADEYMSDINWYFVAGVSIDPISYLGTKLVFNGKNCDGFVDWKSALAMGLDIGNCTRLVVEKTHHHLRCDPHQEIYHYITEWIRPDFRIMSFE